MLVIFITGFVLSLILSEGSIYYYVICIPRLERELYVLCNYIASCLVGTEVAGRLMFQLSSPTPRAADNGVVGARDSVPTARCDHITPLAHGLVPPLSDFPTPP